MTTAPRPALDPTRDIRLPVAVAKWPFLALGPQQAELTYEGTQGGRRVYVHLRAVDAAVGVATVNDIDIIAWATSIFMQLCDDGRPFPDTLELRPSELLRFGGRPSGGRQQHLLAASLDRLANTFVQTNISPGGGPRDFKWIEIYAKPQSRQGTWQVRFTSWLHEVVAHRQVLKVGTTVFKHRGLRRRLYLWACAHAGRGSYVSYSLQFADAYRRSGSHTPIRKFIYELRGAVARNDLPGFALAIKQHDDSEHLVMTRTTELPTEPDRLDASSLQPLELQLPSEHFVVEAAPAELSFPLPDSPERTEKQPALSFPVPQESELLASVPVCSLALPNEPEPPASHSLAEPERRHRSVNTPLATGRLRRNTYS